MKIELEIPDQYAKTNLYVFAGMTPIARKRGDKWEIKTAECSRCGDCCLLMSPQNHPFGTDHGCRYLKIDKYGGQNICSLGIFRPYCCAISDQMADTPNCTVRWG